MGMTIVEPRVREPMRVVIAGAGVGALEAVLALRRLAEDRVRIDLLAPERDFVLRQLSVAEPFGVGHTRRFPLAQLAADQGIFHRRVALVGIEPDRRLALTDDGERLPYDVLVLATGAQSWEAVPGALTFRGPSDVAAMRGLVGELETGAVTNVAFAVPAGVAWTLPLYELALLTSAHLASRGVRDVDLTVVTPEARPLDVFGRSASEMVERLLGERGIEWRGETEPLAVEDGRLTLSEGALAVDRVVALPRLDVPPMAGVPQQADGFVPTAAETGAVEGLEDVYAVGDVTTHPVKQGGLAAQQADAVAAVVARRAGADVEEAHRSPTMRGTLLGGELPRYLRSGSEKQPSEASEHPLWWPSGAVGKVAARYLAPYLSEWGRERLGITLADLDDPGPGAEQAARAALEFALSAADVDAKWGDYASALKWLQAAEDVGIVLPRQYADKQRAWERRRRETTGR